MGKNAGDCPHLCGMGDSMDLQYHRMQYKMLRQKFTVIMKGREAPDQTAVPRTAGQDVSREQGC